jgi:hypothetical protein
VRSRPRAVETCVDDPFYGQDYERADSLLAPCALRVSRRVVLMTWRRSLHLPGTTVWTDAIEGTLGQIVRR